jgi:type I restriction enzyme M protein
MIVGEMKQQIDSIWNDFWSGGLSNPLAVMEQITYLLFIKRLDELHTKEESKAAGLKLKKLERRIFPVADPVEQEIERKAEKGVHGKVRKVEGF